MIKVLLVAERSVVRAGLRFFLSGTEFDVVAEAGTEAEVRDAIRRFEPAVVVFETTSPLVSVWETVPGRCRNVFFSDSWTKEELLRSLRPKQHRPNVVETTRPLTKREVEVLQQIAEGLCNKEIAKKLGICVETVKEHVRNVLRKTGLADRTQAAIWAVRNGV